MAALDRPASSLSHIAGERQPDPEELRRAPWQTLCGYSSLLGMRRQRTHNMYTVLDIDLDLFVDPRTTGRSPKCNGRPST